MVVAELLAEWGKPVQLPSGPVDEIKEVLNILLPLASVTGDFAAALKQYEVWPLFPTALFFHNTYHRPSNRRSTAAR